MPAKEERLVALNRYLFEEQGFHGSRTDYANRSNSVCPTKFWTSARDCRSRCRFYISRIAKKHLGLNASSGSACPVHFLARHEPKHGQPQLVDVFNRGHFLTSAEARAMCEELNDLPWQDSFLKHVHTSPSDSGTDAARNLFNAASNRTKVERMLRYTEAALIIKPRFRSRTTTCFAGYSGYQLSRSSTHTSGA